MNVSKNLSAIIAVIMVVSMVAVGATAVGAVGTQSAVEDTTLSTSEEVGVTGALTDSFRSSGAQSTPELDSQSAQVADQLKGASGETTVLLKVDRNIQVEGSLPSEFSSEELEQDSEATLQPVVDSVNSLPNAEVTQRIVIGNALVVEIDLDQHDIDQLATIPGVEAVAPNIKFEHPAQLDESTGAVSPSDVTVPDPDAEYTWGLQQIGIPSFDEQFDVRGEGANVTIIDDGISDGDHPDLEFAQKVNIVDNEINVGAIGVTDNAHGEHVAGTATGALDPAGDVPRYGVAPNASLTKINVFEGTPGASFANILTAVDYAVTERNADVAGLSLGAGGPVSTVASIVDAQMREAKAAGTLVTVSAGNGGDFFQGGDEGAPVSTPATEFDAFSVGASADQPAVINTTEAFPPSIPSSIAAFTGSNNDITQFSSGAIVSDRQSLDLLEGTVGVGDFYPDDYPRQYVQPDVAAPGLFVLSSGPLGNDAGAPGVNATSDGYSWTQGTSMAQPHVAGAVALIQSATEEELGPQEISAALTETAEKPDNASEKFPSIGERDIRYGAGIINVTAAALAAQNMTEATGTVTDDAGEPVTGASLETEEGALVRTIDGEYSLASTESTPNVTVNAYGFDPVTEELTSDDQTFTLDRDLTVTEVVQGQPGTTESGGEFTIVADVASVETFTLELSDSSSFQVGVDERDLTASIAGVGEIPFGQPVSLGNFTGLAEITVSISETADVATGDQLLLDHTFEGSGESVSVTTGPTTLVDAAGAVSSVSIDADFIGTINDQPTTTVTAEGILKDGEPSTGDRLTFTIGGEPVATAVSDGGVATAEVNAEALDLGPQEDVTVDVLEFEAAQTDTVDIVDEVADLEEGFNLLSVPQPATLTTQDVSSLNVWDSEDETYDAVTSPEFDTASDLHDGLYVDASSDNARLGFTFNEDVPVGGTQDVNTDWNLLGANFPLDSEDIGTNTTIENDLTGVDADALELFRGDFSEFLTQNSQVGPFEAYWAFNPATSADERGIASPSYDEGNRRDVLGQGESDFQPNITNIETTSVEDADDEITLDDRDVVGASEQVVLVDVTVENNGNGTDVQFVTLEVAPQVGPGSSFELADQTGIELGPGESGNVTLAFVASQDDVSPLPSFVPDDVAIEVTTEDGDAEDVGIPFDDGGITVEDQALSTGGEFGVENVDVAGHGTVQLVDANDNVLDSVEFAQGINEEVTFTVDDPANVTDDVTVRVLDDNELEELTSETVAVLDTRFTVSNNAPEFALVNETVDVPVTVTSNVAVPEDDVSVNFSVGGTDAGSQTVDLDAFESETVNFSVDTTGLSVGDTVEHTATSPDDSDTRTLTITETSLSFSDQALSAVSDGASDGGDGGNDSGTTSGAPDVVITLDVSGSMGSPPSKLANAKAGAKDLVNRLSEDSNIGLVAFESDVTVAQELTTNKSQVRQAIDSLTAGGSTNMSGGINESQALLEQQSDADTDDVMVVLGNGGANVVGDQATINASLDARNASNVSAVGDGTTLISLAYGSGADVTLMEQISSPPKVIDGVINESDENAFDSDQDDIEQVFQDIGESIAGDQQVLVEDVTARPGQSVVITDTNFTVKGAVDVANITNSSDGINDRNVLVPVNSVDAGDHIAHVVEDTSDVSASGPGLVNEQATLAAVGIQPIENKSIAEESLPNDVVESVTVDVDAGDRNETFTVEIDRGGTVLGNATTSADAESVTVTLDEPVTKDDTANETVALDATLIGADDAEFDRADETAQFQPFSDRERFTIGVGEAGASVSLPDQVLGSANVSGQDQPAVAVEDVTGSAGQFVVVTDDAAPYDILGSVELQERAAGDEVIVPLGSEADAGDYRAHLTSDVSLLGDDGLVTDAGTVFNGNISISGQSFVGDTDQITVDSSDLQANGPAEYRIVVHDQTQADNGSVGPPPSDVGPRLGFSGVLNGTESNVTIDLNKEITSTQDVLVMIHFPNVGGSLPGAAIPVVNDSAFGFSDGQAGTVTDTATVTIEPAPANYELSNLDPVDPVVSPGQTFDVSADVTNTGDLAGSQTIELRLDGDVVDSQEAVEVGPGNSTTVTFENVSVDTVGEFTHTVASENDTVNGILSVANERVTFDDQSLTADGEVLVTDVTTTTADQQVVITDSEFNVVGQTGDLGGVVVQENFLINVSTTPGEHIAHIVSNASEADGGPGLVTDRATVVDAEVSVDDVSVNNTNDNLPVTVDEITVQTANVSAATQTNFTVEIRQGGTVIGNSTVLNGTNTDVTVSLDQPIEATSVGEVTEDITAVLVDENGSAFQIANEDNDGLVPVENDATVTINITEAGANIALPDQALGAANGSDAVFTEDVTGSADQFVVITPADSEEILGSTELSQDVAGEQVIVELDQQIDAGEFRAHLTTETGLLGDGDALVTDNGTISEAEVDFQDQDFVGTTSDVTVATANVFDGADNTTKFGIAIHETDQNGNVGDIIGTEANLTGANSDVTVSLDETVSSDAELVAMLHFSNETAIQNPIRQVVGADAVSPVLDRANLTAIESDQRFNDQILTDNSGDEEILIENVQANQTSAVVVTYPNDGNLTIAGLTTGVSSTTGQDVPVTINDAGGFPGEHTVHIIPGSGLSQDYSAGDNVSSETAANITSNETATVFDATLSIDDQAFEDSTNEVVINTSNLQPAGTSDYRIVVHNQTGVPAGEVGPGIGTSTDISGSQDNVTVTLGESLTETTDVLAMIHFPSGGPAIPTLNSDSDTFGNISTSDGVVTDTATIEIEQAVNGNVTFSDQALSSDSNVTVENIQSVDINTVGGSDTGVDAFDPEDDFLVLTDGTSVNDGSEGVIDAVQLSEVADGADVALNASGVAAGEFTVVLHEPNAAGDAPDASAPRTNASSGEVVNATATVFKGSVEVATDQLNEEQEPLDEIDVNASLVDATDFTVNVTGDVSGNVTDLSGDAGTVTVPLDQEVSNGDSVTATIERNGETVQQATSAPGFAPLDDTNSISVVAANFALSNLNISGKGDDAAVDAGASPSDVGFTVENTGGAAAQATVDLNITDNSTGASVITDSQTTFTLSNGDSLTTAFRDVDLGGLDPGNYTVEVSTDDGTVTGSLTVNGTNFNVSALNIADQGDNATIREDEDFAVNATVDNLGNAQGTQDVVVNITNAAGNDVANASETITVTGGSSDTVNFTGLNVDVGITAEDFSVSVSSENTTATGDLRVNPLNVGVDITDVDVTNNEIEIGDGPTPVDVTIENLADQELTRTVTVEVVDNETGPTGVTASASQTLRSGDTLGTTLDLATGTLDQGNYTINATTETDEDSVAFDVNFANVSNLDQTEGFDTLDAALENLNDGDELRIGDVTLDNEPTGVTLSNNNVRVFGQGTGATTVQTNLTVTGDNNVIEALTLEGNFTDSGTNNTISGANVTSASPGGFVFIEAGADATINNTAAENVVIDQDADASIQQQSSVSGTLTNNGTADISNTTAGTVENNGNATVSDSDVDIVTGTGDLTIQNPSPGAGEVFVDNVTTTDTIVETFDSIQEANDNAGVDANLTLGNGTFSEEVTVDVTGVTIESAGGVNSTVSASSGTVFTVTADDVTIDGVTIEANSGSTGVDAGGATDLVLQNNNFETDSSGTVYVTGESGLASDLSTVLDNNNFDPSAVVEAGEIVVEQTDVQIDSAEFDNGDSENDSVTILGSFLNTATELIGSIVVGFGNIAGNVGLGNVGLGNVDVGNVEVGDQEFNVGNVDVGNNGELNISLDENIDLSDVDNDAEINITIDDIDTTAANVDNGNVSVDFEDTDGNSVAQNETNSSTA